MNSSEKISNKTWPDLINESVHTKDDVDIGDIYAVNRDFIVVKRGLVNIHYYYIPINHVEGWDNNVLWLRINEEQVKERYERDDLQLDPSRYHIKGHDRYNSSFSELKTISSKIAEPAYSFDIPVTTTSTNVKKEYSDNKLPVLFKCDLCNESAFNSENELSDHIRLRH
ncbi:MAG TPA: hypothetical protein VIY08_09025 [Candidatus Nitrosocosmicus sp.]